MAAPDIRAKLNLTHVSVVHGKPQTRAWQHAASSAALGNSPS